MNRRLIIVLLSAAALGGGGAGCMSDDIHLVGDNGNAGDTFPISGADAATRLARTLWSQSSPDAAWVAATGPTLRTRGDVRALALQMLGDPRARTAVTAFYRTWLDLDSIPGKMKDALKFPEWNAALAQSMIAEVLTFSVAVTLDMDGTVTTLFTAPFSYMNQSLARIYGITTVSGDALQMTPLAATGRAGILTQPGLAALNSSSVSDTPTVRGNYIRRRVFCADVPNPPVGSQTAPAVDPARTRRQNLEAVVAPAACHACHQLIDPLGFAYDGFDPIGRVRTTDNGLPLDLTGRINGGSADGQSFNGPLELAAIITATDDVHRCLAQQWLSFLLGRPLVANSAADARSRAEIVNLAAAANFNLRALIAAAVSSESFLARR